MPDDERLVRRLIWQNGLLRGLLAVTNKALGGEIDSDECKKLSVEVERVLTAPLPDFLKDPEPQGAVDDRPPF